MDSDGQGAFGTWNRGGGLLLFGIVAAASVLLFLDSWQALAGRWLQWSYGYDHGWLIAALPAWLVWRERNVLAAGRPCWPGLILVAGAAAGWLLARAADVGIGQEILLPVPLWGATLTVFGPVAARALAFPLGFLYFAIPIWDFVNPFLQAATTAVVGAMLVVTGVPSLVEGNIVTIPAGRFEIAGGCAGVAFFMTAGALAALYGHLHYDGRWGRRLLLLVIAFAGAMVLNWVRVYVVIVAGHLTDMQHYLVRVDHYTFGWALFTVALLPFYVIARRIEPALTAQEHEHKYELGATATRPPASPQATVVAAVVRELKWTERERGAQRGARAATQEGYARLKVIHRGHRVADTVLMHAMSVIGRDQDCQVVIDDKFFSRRHAVIMREDDGWILRDLNSTNGTWVNGKPARTCHLKDGDTIEIGKHRLVFLAGREADVGVATQSMDAAATGG